MEGKSEGKEGGGKGRERAREGKRSDDRGRSDAHRLHPLRRRPGEEVKVGGSGERKRIEGLGVGRKKEN